LGEIVIPENTKIQAVVIIISHHDRSRDFSHSILCLSLGPGLACISPICNGHVIQCFLLLSFLVPISAQFRALDSCQNQVSGTQTTGFDFRGCGQEVTFTNCKFSQLTASGGTGFVLSFATIKTVTITGSTFEDLSNGNNVPVIVIGPAGQFTIEQTKFMRLTSVGVIGPPDGITPGGEFWIFDVTLDTIEYSGDILLKSPSTYNYCDNLKVTNVGTPRIFFALPKQSATEVAPTFVHFTAESVSTQSWGSTFNWWPEETPSTYLVWESCSFKNTQVKFHAYTMVYFENSVVTTAAADKIGWQVDGTLSVVGCNFTGPGTAIKTAGDQGSQNIMLICHSRFSGCKACIDAEGKTHWRVVNCLFTGWVDFAIKVKGDDSTQQLLKQCAFYEPVSNTAIGVTGTGKGLALDTVCFGYDGCAIDTTGVAIIQNCRFKAVFATATKQYLEITVSGWDANHPEKFGFGSNDRCGADNVSFDDPGVCSWNDFKPRMTDRPTKSPKAEAVIPAPSISNSPKPTVPETPEPSLSQSPDPTVSDTPEPSLSGTPEPTVSDSQVQSSAATTTPQPSISFSPKPTPTGTASSFFELTMAVLRTPFLADSSLSPQTRAFSATPPCSFTGAFLRSDGIETSGRIGRSAATLGTELVEATQNLDSSDSPSASPVFEVTRSLTETNAVSPTAPFQDTVILLPTPAFAETELFTPTTAFAVTAKVSGSLPFKRTETFSISLDLKGSAGVANSDPFGKSFTFTVSNIFTPSVPFTASELFTPSAPFTASATIVRVPIIPGAAEQIAGGLGSGGAIGAGVAGVAVIAALLLLLLFVKKKRHQKESNELVEQTTQDTFTNERVEYISEYGLSDNVLSTDDLEGQEDLPREVSDAGIYNSDAMNASEHNPDELDDGALDPDES
jgi:hypothetical protein